MSGVNRAIIIGNVGGDVVTRAMPSGAKVASFSVATSEHWKDKENVKQERTEWHQITCFGPLASFAQEYLKKGEQVYVEGSLRTSKWQDKSGQERRKTEIVAKEINRLWGSAQTAEKPAVDDDCPY
jgi:single-strand DNA-binding protein